MAKIKSFTKTYACDKPHYPYQLPEGWVWTTVGEIGDVVTGNTPSKDNLDFYGGNIPFFKPTDLEQGVDTKFSNDRLSLLGYEASRKLPANTVLVTCIGATIGKTGLISVEGSCNQQINAIIPTKSVVPYFLYYTCVSEYMQNEIKNNASATTLPILNKGNFSKIAFSLPPLEEQKRIVFEIERWLSFVDVVERGKSDLQTTISQAKSKILDLAIHGKLVPQDPNDEPASELLKRINPKAEITCDNPQYGKLPKGWCETLLGNIGNWQSGATPSRLRKDYYNGDIHWLKTGDLNDGVIKSIPETITRKALEETSVKLNPIGSVLIAMYGATIGKIGILALPATTNQACCACVNYMCDKMFLFYFLLANREHFIAMGGGGAQPNISKEKIINTHIPLPPLSEQQRIVAKIEELFAQLEKIGASL